jgi:hypothetical protein
MREIPLFAAMALLSCSVAPRVAAQDALGVLSSKEARPALRSSAAPAGRTDSLMDGVDFDAEYDEDEQRASVQFGKIRVRNLRTSNGQVQRASSWLVRATVPVSNTENLSAWKPLDALSDGAKLTFSFSRLRFPSAAERVFSREFASVMAEAHARCVATGAMDCGAPPVPPNLDYARKYLDDGRVNRAAFSGIVRFGGEAALGADRFEHVDPLTLAEKKPSKLQASAGLFLIYYPADAMSTLVARVAYQNAFEKAEPQEVCKPVVVDPVADCVRDARLAPKHVERANLSIEYRRMFDLGSSAGMIAISPKMTFDAVSGAFEAGLPLYFVPAKEGPISPGISVTYSSKSDQVRFGAFLKSTFSF